jgi:hypothetical protein
MDNNKKLLDAISAALRDAGYTDIAAQDGSDGATVTAKKGTGGAYFRLIDKPKARVAMRTTAGGPEVLATPLEVSVAPAVADLHDHLLKNPQLAPAFGFSVEAISHLK